MLYCTKVIKITAFVSGAMVCCFSLSFECTFKALFSLVVFLNNKAHLHNIKACLILLPDCALACCCFEI